MPSQPFIDIDAANQALEGLSPSEIIRWALAQNRRVVASTSFGPNSGALLHLVAQESNDTPVIWVDSGYNMRDTYLVAEQLIKKLNLNMHVQVPAITSERLNVMMGGIPTLDEPEKHEEFTRIVKLDPFNQALEQLQPEIWINGVMRSDTEFRQSLDIASWDSRGILKIAPILNWDEEKLESYMEEHNLPSCRHYFDPTKVESGRECGLHTAA